MSTTQTVVSVTERSTKAAVAATAALVKAANDLQTLALGAEEVSQEIQFRRAELSQINAQYDEKLAEAKAELRIKILGNEDDVLGKLLKARGLVTIEPGELDNLRDNLTAAQQEQEDAVNEAFNKGRSTAEASAKAQAAQVEAAHRVAIAELTANSNAKDDRIEMLAEQLSAAREDLKAERDTRLAVAQAESGRQGVVVNTGK